MKIAALNLLTKATERGWRCKVVDADYDGDNPTRAWEAVKSVDASTVMFYKGSDYLGAAYLMAPGPATCEPDETVIDYTTGGEFGEFCDKLFEED